MRSACSKPRGNQPESPSSSAEPSGSTGRGCSQWQTRLLSQRGQTGGSGHRLSPRCPGVGDTMSPEAGTRDQPIPAGGVAPEGSQGAGKEGPGSARVWRGQGRPGRRGAEQDTQPCRRSSQASPRDGTARPAVWEPRAWPRAWTPLTAPGPTPQNAGGGELTRPSSRPDLHSLEGKSQRRFLRL